MQRCSYVGSRSSLLLPPSPTYVNTAALHYELRSYTEGYETAQAAEALQFWDSSPEANGGAGGNGGAGDALRSMGSVPISLCALSSVVQDYVM